MSTDTDNTLLPPAFVEALSGAAYETLREWLEANAPANVLQLFDDYEGLLNYNHQLATDAPPEVFERMGIVDMAVTAIQAISDLGGAFRGVDGGKHRAEDYKPLPTRVGSTEKD